MEDNKNNIGIDVDVVLLLVLPGCDAEFGVGLRRVTVSGGC